MRYTPQEHNLCVNTTILNRYLDAQAFQEDAFEYVYAKIVDMFRDQLGTVTCKEDIYDDLYFETKYMIDRDSFDADAHEVVGRILKDFDVKDAE